MGTAAAAGVDVGFSAGVSVGFSAVAATAGDAAAIGLGVDGMLGKVWSGSAAAWFAAALSVVWIACANSWAVW